jgi:hypothetical protein
VELAVISLKAAFAPYEPRMARVSESKFSTELKNARREGLGELAQTAAADERLNARKITNNV